VIPHVVRRYRVFAYPFRDPESDRQVYWRDVGTLDAFWQANMELVAVTPELNLYDEIWPILTTQTTAPPSARGASFPVEEYPAAYCFIT
jgi:glucose-1-phosphate adenylyltransferase